MSLPAMIDAMVAAGCTPEQLAAVVRVHSAAEEARVANDAAKVATETARVAIREIDRKARVAERKRHERSQHVAVTDRDRARHGATDRDVVATECDTCLSPKKEVSPTPPIEKTTPIQTSLRSEFVSARHADFYAAYPKKVEPKASLAKFIVAVRSGVDPERIVAAGKRFAAAHREAGTDKQFIPAPAVWLNRGGYDSEDLPTAPARAGPTNGAQPTKTNARLDVILESIEDERNGNSYDKSLF